jgi:hypothetical protein
MQYLATIFAKKMDKKERKRVEYVKLNRKKLKNWDAVLSPRDYLICVLGIKSSDGKTDHAICIADGWIFDSTFEKALVLSVESLDLCSSSTDRATQFMGVTRGHLLKERIGV